MRSALILGLSVLAVPGIGWAQSDNRRNQAYENLRQLEQTLRIDDITRQLDNLEIQQKTQQNLQSLNATRAAPPAPQNPYALQPYAPVITAAQIESEDRARDAELDASNARLRIIAAQQRAYSR